jgi:hypothetical protein
MQTRLFSLYESVQNSECIQKRRENPAVLEREREYSKKYRKIQRERVQALELEVEKLKMREHSRNLYIKDKVDTKYTIEIYITQLL